MSKAAVKPSGYTVDIHKVNVRDLQIECDAVAVEEPLEIRLGFFENGKKVHKPISITMRSPGDDFQLAAGFLFTEGIVSDPDEIDSIKFCGKFPNNKNTVRVDVLKGVNLDLKRLERNFYTTSSCGVCGKTSIEALATGAKVLNNEISQNVSYSVLHELPRSISANQKVFDETGGLHAAALFDLSGELIDLKEDVGRHNAVDKLIGQKFLDRKLPLESSILFLSGRASFELVQKAVMAQIPVIAAVGAPSSLAVEAARSFNATLVGFVRDRRFNIYAGKERIDI
ncbi:MAG: formate dehydrogenase accessory sulfurtransferase FdhD [Pyrinomonadaceae bacterium]|nr:formate dehydrogenase accessory sulfurtransferase FdhD [Pyrinomonadaceae bacterium]